MHNKWTIRLSGDIPDGRHMRTIEDTNQPDLPFTDRGTVRLLFPRMLPPVN
jgi:hypothetical protein